MQNKSSEPLKPKKPLKQKHPSKPDSIKKSGFLVVIFFFLIYAVLGSKPMTDPNLDISQTDAKQIELQKTLKIGWQVWYPYQYLAKEAVLSSLTGLDVQLVQKLSEKAGFIPQYQNLPWNKIIDGLQNGNIDFVSGATYAKEREAFAYYSKPYRFEEDALFVLRKKTDHYKFKNVSEFITFIQKNNFRLGVVKKVLYADSMINNFINDPNNAKFITIVDYSEKGFAKLAANEVDGLLTDRIAGSTYILEAHYSDLMKEINLGMRTPIHLIFSKKTVPKTTVLQFDKAIDHFISSSAYRNIVSWYLYPVILMQTVEAEWFRIVDMLGTLFFSISGVLIARSLNASIFAAFVYAVIPSLGGGLIRDVIFNHNPVDALSTPIYMGIVVATVIIGFFIIKLIDLFEQSKHAPKFTFYKKAYPHLHGFLMMCDAFGLAAFTVIGVMESLVAKVNPLWLWGPFFSFVTGAVGTIIRDILSKSKKLADIEGEIYSEVAIIWGLFLSIGLLMTAYNVRLEIIQGLVLITMLGTFFTRILAYIFKVPNVYFE